MRANDLPLNAAAWRARLRLLYRLEGDRTVLAQREHEGPLAIQKSLYPEGGVCHQFILHPPAGLAGGDALEVDVRLEAQTHCVLSTPGAGKWYRSAGASAHQRLHFGAAAGATLEWLPQETIFYAGTSARLHTHIELARGARYLGWEINCLGRPASGESFNAGAIAQHSEIHIDGQLRWHEQGRICGDDPLLASPIGLDGHSVHATLLAAGVQATPQLLQDLRALNRPQRLLAVTALDEVLVIRHLGASAQVARELFAACREYLRPWLCAVKAQPLRIWRT